MVRSNIEKLAFEIISAEREYQDIINLDLADDANWALPAQVRRRMAASKRDAARRAYDKAYEDWYAMGSPP